MNGLRAGSLFSGYGGLDMAVEHVFGAQVAWHAEIEPAPARILAHHWPHAPNLGDVTAIDWGQVEPVDLLLAGYPCQPFSDAGLRKGEADERYLWPQVVRAARALGPRYLVLENVRGHLVRGFPRVLGDLTDLGYDVRWTVVPASAAGACHRRLRLFAVATNTECLRRDGWAWPLGSRRRDEPTDGRASTLADSDVEPRLGSRVTLAGAGAGADGQRPAEPRRRSGSSTHANRAGLEIGSGVGGNPREERPPAVGGGTTADPARHGWDEGWPEPARVLGGPDASERSNADWGALEPAVRRWEHVLGRPAPEPTEPGLRGNRRLSPRFVEWMMGLPAGHVTDVPGISRNEQLKALGNGVVPQQAELALRHLLALTPAQPAPVEVPA